MQVGLPPTAGSGITPTPPSRGGAVSHTGAVTRTQKVATRTQPDFPDSPLISTRPIRYNVQLNEQLTAVQRADVYLRNTESHLLQLRQAINSNAGATVVSQRAEGLVQLLQKRTVLSGNTVDRQLQVSLEGKTQVHFLLPDAQKLLQGNEEETLMFSLRGGKREISAVHIGAQSSPEQVLLKLNQGLGRWGIHGQLNEKQQLTFQVDESTWGRVSGQLSIRGEGHRYPAEQFYPLTPVAEPALEERIQEIVVQPRLAKSRVGELENALEQVTQQRRNLLHSKERVQQRIDSMATYEEPGAALQASEQIGQILASAGQNYRSLSQALRGQANVNQLTVKNILAGR